MARRFDNKQARGFTLIELMIVVTIVGALGTIGVYGVRKYVLAAKTSEALAMVTGIKSHQEAYKDETYAYLDVSKGSYASLYPMTNPNGRKHAWQNPGHTDYERWQQLGAESDGPVLFGYAVVSGAAGTGPTGMPATEANLNYPATSAEPWYVIVARGDNNGDGHYSLIVSSSFTREVYVEKDTE